MTRYWSVQAETQRGSVSDFCLRWGLILADDQPDTLRHFCDSLHDRDCVVLHEGGRRVWGVGLVAGDADRRPDLADVWGVEAPHFRRVHWLWRAEMDDPRVLPYGQLDSFNRISRLHEESAWANWVERIVSDAGSQALPALPELPSVDNESVSVETIADLLSERGLPGEASERMRGELGDLVQIAAELSDRIFCSEHDKLAFLVIPLLRMLGWTPRHVNIYPGRVPVIVNLYDGDKSPSGRDPSVLVDVRFVYPPERLAASGLKGVAERPSGKHCRSVILTDGIRYGVYEHQGDGVFPARPTAWLNLQRMRSRYPLMECEGAVRAVELMSEGPGG